MKQMRRWIYFCMALLLCFFLYSCDGGQGSVTESTAETAVETTEIVTVIFKTTAVTTETTPLETTAPETTAETTVVTTAETTVETTAQTTTAAATAAVTAAPTTAPKENKFMPSVLAGEYTYNNGSESVIEVVDGVTYVNGILIANKTYSLPEDFNPGGLHPDAKAAFDEMRTAAAAEGITLKIISGYRSYSQQTKTYGNYVARDGKEEADRYSARPGHSEHQTGLAMDINSLQQSFADTAAGKWLAEHCAEYGFIIRYTADKEPETGFMYEPWHIRYLGVEMAKAVTESGLCLEEYLGITSVYAD